MVMKGYVCTVLFCSFGLGNHPLPNYPTAYGPPGQINYWPDQINLSTPKEVSIYCRLQSYNPIELIEKLILLVVCVHVLPCVFVFLNCVNVVHARKYT